MGINASLRYFKTTDNLNLYYQHWIPESPKALIIYVHDIGDHICRRGNIVRCFVEKNYAAALYDQRGHGKSDGPRGDAGQFGEFVNDLSTFIHFSRAAVPKGTPIFLIGHGVGGQFVINLLVPAWNAIKSGFVSHPGKINGFVTISALIEPIDHMPHWKKNVLNRLVKIFPSLRMAPGIEPKDLSNDCEIIESYRRDDLVNKRISLRLKKQIVENTHIIMAMASRIQIPALMLHGSLDTFASPEGTKKFFSRLPSFPKRLHIYEERLHELTNDEGSENVFRDIESWLEEVLSLCPSKEHWTQKENVCGTLPFVL